MRGSERIDRHESRSPRLKNRSSIVKSKWESCRYKFVSDDEIATFEFDDKKVAEAIKAGHLKGEVTYGKVPRLFGRRTSDPEINDVNLTSTRAELRKYLMDHPDDCFNLKNLFCELKRVVDKKKASPSGNAKSSPDKP